MSGVLSVARVDAPRQHEQPCADCPWRRVALAGWLGGVPPDQWIQLVHSDAWMPCHTLAKPIRLRGRKLPWDCAGAAIFRANVCKRPRPDILTERMPLVLPADRERVFATDAEFLTHHGNGPPPTLWERVEPLTCDLCHRVARWKHPLGGLRCGRCPRPEVDTP